MTRNGTEIGEACDQSLDDPSQAFIHKARAQPDDAETWYVMTPVSLCIKRNPDPLYG